MFASTLLLKGLPALFPRAAAATRTHFSQASRSTLLNTGYRNLPTAVFRARLMQDASFNTSALSSFAALSQLPPLPEWANFQNMGLLKWLVLDVGINWLGWAVAALFKTEVFYDALGSVSFATLTIGSFLANGGASAGRKILVTTMVAAWTVRLGGFLIARITRDGHDTRFAKAKNEPGTFFIYWTMQALWVFSTLLPVLIVNSAPAVAALSAIDMIGVSIFASGLLMETTADAQKWAFKSDPDNKGKFISSGLWSISRHPNYFGEIMVWVGVFVTCCPALKGAQWAAVISPLFVTFLLSQVSGVPILEKSADRRWGDLDEYKKYKAETPVLIPYPLAGKPGYDA